MNDYNTKIHVFFKFQIFYKKFLNFKKNKLYKLVVYLLNKDNKKIN